jgi:hypothetical protein
MNYQEADDLSAQDATGQAATSLQEPTRGGSYTRDPQTGELTRNGPVPDGAEEE